MPSLVFNSPEGIRRFTLSERSSIGRSPECDILISDSSVSRKHASITLRDGRYHLEDEGGRFGSFVNGKQVTKSAPLEHGDEVRIGNVSLRFETHTSQVPISGPDHTPAPFAAPEGNAPRVRELEARVSQLERTQRRTQTLLALSELFLKCTSAPTLIQAVGPDLVSTVRGDRGLIALKEPGGNKLSIVFSRELSSFPAHRQPTASNALKTGQAVIAPVDEAGRAAVLAPLLGRGNESHGLVYVELPPGRHAGQDEVELFKAMSGQVGTALANLNLQQRVRREEQARADLSRYVSDQVAEAVLAGRIDLKLGGEMRKVTVLFFDVRGFTSLSEKLSPEHVLEILNECFAEAVPIVKKAQGTVDKFIGDSLMAVFGAPNALEDQALRAVQAARAIRKALRALPSRWVNRPFASQLDLTNFSVGIGINTGLAIAGNLGTDERKEYAVIGDCVNVSSRLCSVAKRDQIVIGISTADEVHDRVSLGELGPLKVKGRAEAVQAFEVLDE